MLERRQGVLRGPRCPAAMGERDRARATRGMGGAAASAPPWPAVWSTHDVGPFPADRRRALHRLRVERRDLALRRSRDRTGPRVRTRRSGPGGALGEGRARRRPAADMAARRGARHRSPPPRPSDAKQFAKIIADEAAKPMKTARVEAERAVGTFQFSAAEARTMAGDVVPLDAIPSGVGKVGFTMRVPIGVVGAISPFNFPLNLVVHKVAPAIAAGCPVVLKPAGQTPFSAIALAELLIDDCGLPSRVVARRHRRRVDGRQRHRRPPGHRDDHVHRFARGRVGDPGSRRPQEGRPRAREQRARDHRGGQRLADRRPRRSRWRGSPTPARAASRRSGSWPRTPSTTSSSIVSSRRSRRWSSATRSTKGRTCRR